MNSGCINESQPGFADNNGLLNGISCGACNFCDDDPFETGKGIQQAGFAYIGFAHDGGGYTLLQDSALAVGIQ